VNKNESKLYVIFAYPEHIHFFVSRSPSVSEEELFTIISDGSEKFISKNKLGLGPFSWQSRCTSGASAFSVSMSDIDRVCTYILSQPEHNRKHSFADEYEQFLKHYQVTLKNKVDKVGDN
jgi:hypothetical protein